MEKVNLSEKLDKITEHWKPKIIGELNGQHLRLVKFRGEFIWHHHDEEDELFLVLEGRLVIRLRDRDITLNAGEFFIVPRGVEHCPIADREVHALLLEPAGTLNTGNVRSDRTVENPEWI